MFLAAFGFSVYSVVTVVLATVTFSYADVFKILS